MLLLAYFLLALGSAATGWAISAGTAVLLAWGLYQAAALVWNMLIEVCSSHADVCWQAPFLPPPSPLLDWFAAFLPWGTALLLLLVLLQMVRPAGQSLKALSRPYRCERLSRNHPLLPELAELSRRMNIRPPRIFLIHQPETNAFAISSGFGSAVGLSAPLLQSLTPKQLMWVCAHEYSHIRHRDSLARAFWIASLRLSRIGFRLQATIERWILHGVFRLFPILGHWLVVPLSWMLAMLNGVLMIGHRVSVAVFRLLIRWVDRRIEFRADREAGQAIDPLTGIEVMQVIDSHWELPSRLMHSTHPPAWDRIDRLSHLSMRTQHP